MKPAHLALALCFVMVIDSACGPPPPSDGRTGRQRSSDAGPNADAGLTPEDSGVRPSADAGSQTPRDTGVIAPRDTGAARPDTGPPPPRDTGPAPCTYPAQNQGVEIGQTVPEGLAWQGLGPGDQQERQISVREFFDCDGSRGIHGVLIITSQYGCSRCSSQARQLTRLINDWARDGLNIKVLTLKLEDSNGRSPATMEGVNHWRDTYELTNSYVGYDNGYAMVPRSGGGRFGTPLNSFIDPRTMEVIDVIQGTPSYNGLLELARRRAAE